MPGASRGAMKAGATSSAFRPRSARPSPRSVSMPGWRAWGAVLLMGAFSSALAYVLYFRLIAAVGAVTAATVTFLIPAFAVLWGALLLGEQVTTAMVIGGAVILVGTALAIGLLPRPAPQRS